MPILKKIIKLIFLTLLMFSIGCNELEQMQSANDSGAVADDTVADDSETKELSKGVQALSDDYQIVESDISDLEEEFDKLSIISIVEKTKEKENSAVTSKGLSFGVAKKLKKNLKKVTTKLGDMAQKLDGLEAKILLKLAKVDPAVQIVLFEKLQRLLLKLEDMRNKVALMLDKFEEKIEVVIQKIDKMLRNLDFSNPLHIIAYGAIMEIREVLVDFQDDLSQL